MPGSFKPIEEPLRLHHLPEEIIRNIAKFATIPSIISLTSTCHLLRSHCWDHFAFRDKINEGRLIWAVDTLCVDQLVAKLGTDTTSWAQYALADEHANELQGGLDSDLPKAQFELMLRWMPHLVVCHHPFCTSPWLAFKLFEILHTRQSSLSAVFCYAAVMLSTNDDGNDMVAFAADSARNLKTDILKSSTRWRTFRAIGGFAVLLRQAIRGGHVITRNSLIPAAVPDTPTSDLVPHPPSALNIPFMSYAANLGLPVPFATLDAETERAGPPAFDHWLGRKMDAICVAEFVTSGKWTGYFIDQRWGQYDFHPMHDIRFTYRERHEGHKFGFAGTGWDSIGDFYMMGWLNDDLSLTARKWYQGAHEWDWRVQITPFGLFGVWGVEGPPDVEFPRMHKKGAVWLWKEEWTERNEASADE